MKKQSLAILLILVLILSSTVAFSGCSLIAKAQGKTYVNYVQSGAYSVGTMESDVIPDDILIEWYGGSVNVTKYDGDKIIFVEKYNQETNDDLKLHWAYWDSSEYGKYYQIQYCAKGMFDLSEIKKDLYVLLPNNVNTYNKLSITGRGECTINIDLPDVSFIGECNGNPNVHLDTEWGNINAVFKDIDFFRMLGDSDDIANQYYRSLTAEKVDQIDCVASYNRFIFNLKEVTSYANINTFSGDVYFLCTENVRKLTINGGLGTQFLELNTFNKLDLLSKTGMIGVEMHYTQKFQVAMSNYNQYGADLAYKEPYFSKNLGLDDNDEQQITRSGDVWTVLDGKDKYGRINEVKVSNGAETYFGTWQGVISEFTDTGIFEITQGYPQIDIPDEYKSEDNQQQQYDPNNPNGDPNYNPQQNNNQN